MITLFAMAMFLAWLGASGNPIIPGLGSWTGTNNIPVSNAGTITIQFNTDGSITKTVSGIGSSGSISGPTQWAISITAGIGTGVWIRASSIVTPTSFTGPTAFTQLTSNQTFGYAAQTVDRSTTFNIDFSLDGTTVLYTVSANSLFVTHL